MASGTKKPQHFIDELKLPLWKPDRGNVSVGEALFEMRLLSRIAGARKDGVMVREGVGANILGDLGKGLDGAVVAQAATKEEKAETGVEALKVSEWDDRSNLAVVAIGIGVFGFLQE